MLVDSLFRFGLTVYNLVRIRNLMAEMAGWTAPEAYSASKDGTPKALRASGQNPFDPVSADRKSIS